MPRFFVEASASQPSSPRRLRQMGRGGRAIWACGDSATSHLSSAPRIAPAPEQPQLLDGPSAREQRRSCAARRINRSVGHRDADQMDQRQHLRCRANAQGLGPLCRAFRARRRSLVARPRSPARHRRRLILTATTLWISRKTALCFRHVRINGRCLAGVTTRNSPPHRPTAIRQGCSSSG